MTDAVESVRELLLQAPPEEVRDCLNDLRLIARGNDSLQSSLSAIMRQYHVENQTAVKLDDSHKLVLTELNSLSSDEDVFVDAETQTTVRVQPDSLETTAVEKRLPSFWHNQLRSDIANLLHQHCINHYAAAASAVLPQPALDPATERGNSEDALGISTNSTKSEERQQQRAAQDVDTETIEPRSSLPDAKLEDEHHVQGSPLETQTVPSDQQAPAEGTEIKPSTNEPIQVDDESVGESEAIKRPLVDEESTPNEPISIEQYYLLLSGRNQSQSNYWTGAWRSRYSVKPDLTDVSGKVTIQTHYFEQGNVQMKAEFSLLENVDSPSPESVIAAVKRAEQAAQQRLLTQSRTLDEQIFKQLRRALPKTRSKMDWDKIDAYRVGTSQQEP